MTTIAKEYREYTEEDLESKLDSLMEKQNKKFAFIDYIVKKNAKGYKGAHGACWNTLHISTREEYYFTKGLVDLGCFVYAGTLEKKVFEIEGYTITIDNSCVRTGSYTMVETPDGVVFRIYDSEYKYQKSVKLQFYTD